MTETLAGPRRLAGTFEEFRNDLATAVEVWRTLPWLVILGVLLSSGLPMVGVFDFAASPEPTVTLEGAAILLLAVAFVVMLALAVFSLGWSGAERLAYAWQWAGIPVGFREIVAAAWGYVGRFLVLGLLLAIPFALLGAIVSAAAGTTTGMVVASLCLNVLLTFVTPALAYDEDRATQGLRAGVRLLAGQRTRAIWYALIAPAVLIGISVLAPRVPFGEAVAWLVGGVALVAVRGATAAAYLRLTRVEGVSAPPPAGP